MPTIKVNTYRLTNYESDMQGILSRVNSIMNQFNSVSRNLDWEIKAESNINFRLSGISRELSAESRGISGMKNYLETARTRYVAVESKNSGKKLKNEVSGSNSGAKVNRSNSKIRNIYSINVGRRSTATWVIGKDDKITKKTRYANYKGVNVGAAILVGNSKTNNIGNTTTKSGYKPDWAKGIFKVVGKIGNVGSIAGSVYTLGKAISSGDSVKVEKGIINVSKDCISRFGTLAQNAYSGISVKETLFGNWTKGSAVTSLFEIAEEATRATKGTVFKAALAKEFKGYSFKNATNVGSKIKVATKWAGTGLSAVTNFISNKEEQKKNPGMSNARVVSEPVVETAIDVGVGALATAGATALLGAAAPAVAVGAVAVGAVWAVNTATEVITAHFWGEDNKKNLTEFASDAIIDGVTAIGKGVGKAVKNGFNAVTKWGKSLFGG